MRAPYTKQQVAEAIERRGTHAVVPTFLCTWWGDGLANAYGQDALNALSAQYPDDIVGAYYQAPGETLSPTDNPEYRFGFLDYTGKETHSIGKQTVLLESWDALDAFEAHMPSPDEPHIFDPVLEAVRGANGRYVAGCFWRLFHERFWAIRGMENMMCDYYDAMDELKRLGQILMRYYRRIIDRFAQCGVDAIFTSDDLGHQTGPMMSPDVFRELYLPLYKEFIGYAHEKGLHVILHSCGDNTLLMEMLIEAGLDVFHPLQTGCMDLEDTARRFGGRISFLWGVDVQHLLPEGTPEQITHAIEEGKKRLYTERGGLLLGAGNGIMPDTSLDNIRAMLAATHAR